MAVCGDGIIFMWEEEVYFLRCESSDTLLVLKLRNQRPNMWLQHDGKLITHFQEFLGILRGSHARRSTS